MISAIHGAGGDVLKLIGDGILAIFDRRAIAGRGLPLRARRPSAPARAARRAQRTPRRRRLPDDQAYLGLHIGEVFYGNIGSVDRLDFTVVGPAVNEASRIAAMCRSVDRNVLVSSAFHAALPAPDRARLVSVGRYALRGVRRAQELYTLDVDPGSTFKPPSGIGNDLLALAA